MSTIGITSIAVTLRQPSVNTIFKTRFLDPPVPAGRTSHTESPYTSALTVTGLSNQCIISVITERVRNAGRELMEFHRFRYVHKVLDHEEVFSREDLSMGRDTVPAVDTINGQSYGTERYGSL